MVRRIAVLLALATAQPLRGAAAQERRWATLREDVENMVGDVLHVWTAPARADGSDVAGFAALGGAIVIIGTFDDEIQDWIRDNPDSPPLRALRPLRHPQPISRLGYTRTLVPLSLGLYVTGLALGSDPLREAGIGCLTADISNTLARHLLARLLGRLRPQFTRDPYVIEPLAWGDWPMRSFPGGHAANIMACGAFWSNRFDLGIIGPVFYILAAAIGFGRTIDGAHWTTDTLFGLAFGRAVGRSVAGRFGERDDPPHDPETAAAAGAVPGFTIGWRIRF